MGNGLNAGGVGDGLVAGSRGVTGSGPLLSCPRVPIMTRGGSTLLPSSGSPSPVGQPQGFKHVATPSPPPGARRPLSPPPRLAAGRCSRRAILRALPLAVAAGITGCDLGPPDTDLPPVTPLPVEFVNVTPFTPTPSPTPSAPATLAAAEATPLPAGTTIRFAGWGTPAELDALRQALAAFEGAQPEVELDVRLDENIAGDGMRTGLVEGIDADVVRVAADDVFDLTAGGYLAPLDDFVARDLDLDDLAPAVTAARSGPGGEVTALSIGAAYLGVFYNESHLELAGVEPPSSWDDPWSIARFEFAARRLTAADEDRVERYGLAAVPWFTRAALADAAGLAGVDAFFASDQTRSTMHSPVHARTLRRMARWRSNSKVEIGIEERIAAPFNGGLVALYIDASDFAPLVRPSIPWGVAPLPAWTDGSPLTEGLEFCVAVNSASEDLEPAWRLAQFFLEPEAQRALARNDAAVPFRRSVLREPAFRDPNRLPVDRTAWSGAVEHDLQTPSNPGSKAWHVLTAAPIEAVRRGDVEVDAYLEQADELITRQLEAHEWSVAKDVAGYRRPPSLGNVMLREFDERREEERRSRTAP